MEGVTAGKPTITKRHVSFGIELEFLVAYVSGDKEDPDADIAHELAPLLRLPSVDNPSYTTAPRAKVQQRVREAIAQTGLPVYDIWDTSAYAPDSAAGIHSAMDDNSRSAWDIKWDSTVVEAHGFGGYEWTSIEMVSPALWDRDASFEMVHLAVCTVTASFRARVNITSGFHVHVGAGKRGRIDPRTLRKLGAFLWAAAPLLSTLHPPERGILPYSQSMRERDCTRLGKGKHETARNHWETDVDSELRWRSRLTGRDRWLGELFSIADDPFVKQLTRLRNPDNMPEPPGLPPSDTFSEPGRYPQDRLYMDPVTNPNVGSGAGGVSEPPRFEPPRLPPYKDTNTNDDHDDTADSIADLNRQLNSSRNYYAGPNPTQHSAPPRPRPPPIDRQTPKRFPPRRNAMDDPFVRVRAEAYAANTGFDDPNTLANTRPPSRLDVLSGVSEVLKASFSSVLISELLSDEISMRYLTYNFTNNGPRDYSGYDILDGPNTVEFREAGGSLDPKWVVTWARICCGVLKYCRDAADDEWIRVVRLLAWAQEEGADAREMYDVVDLLVDLGLYAEADVAEKRLLSGEAAWDECPSLPGRQPSEDDDWVNMM